MMRAPLRHRSESEAGSSLILVLIFIATIGVLCSALLSYQLTINKQSLATRRAQTRETGVNTGLEWAVNSLRQGKDGFCLGGYDTDVITVGGREVEVSCRDQDKTSKTPNAATNNVALYLNRAEPAELNVVATKGELALDGAKRITGPIYNGRGRDAWDLNAQLDVDGDVLVAPEKDGCDTTATVELPKNLVSTYRNARSCSMPLSEVTPSPVASPCETVDACNDPAPRSLDADGKETKGAAACRVFSPGIYHEAPNLAENNYFQPGVYEFELGTEWKIGAALRGGDPSPQTETDQGDASMSTAPRCPGAPDATEPHGVVFVLGKGTSMRIIDTGRVELFEYRLGEVRLPNVVAGGSERVTEWASSPGYGLERALLQIGPGQPEAVFHAGVYAPASSVLLQGSGDAIETIRNTVVAGRFAMVADGALKRADFGIIGRSGASKKFVLMARSCPGSTTITTRDACTNPQGGPVEQELCALATATVYDDDRRTLYVDNWRVDRDPSPADPATCHLGD